MPKTTAPVRLFRAVTLGHFGIDVFNSLGPVLVAYLREPLQLSAAQVGLAVGIYQLLAGATQPPFGWLADRIGSRVLGPLSVAVTIACVCASVAASRTGFAAFLVLFAVAALGSGAFHPQGTMHAALAIPNRSSTTTAVFFLGGQVGLATGPVLAGVLLDRFGLEGIWVLGLAFLPVPLYMALAMAPRVEGGSLAPEGSLRFAEARTAGVKAAPTLALLVLIFSARAWIFIGTVAFLPLLFQSKGWSSSGQGVVVGAFWIGGAVTGVLLGGVADRISRRAAVSLSTLAGAVVLSVLPLLDGPQAVLAAFLCGGGLGAPHSVLLVIAQDLLPVRRGFASGLSLGFLFAMGAVASWGIGALADRFDLVPVLQAGSLLGVAVALMALALPHSRQRAFS